MASQSEISINILPDDVLLAIIRHLNVTDRCNYQTVCRRWFDLIALSFSYVKSLSMSSTIHGLSTACLAPFYNLLRLCGPYLREISLDLDGRYIDELTLSKICNSCDPRKMKSLRLKTVTISEENVMNLVNFFSGLTSLSLIRVNKQELTDALLSSVMDRCSFLENLQIDGADYVHGKFITSIHGSLIKCSLIRIHILPGCLRSLLQHSLNLETLHLELCSFQFDDLLYLCRRAINLKHLNISLVIIRDMPTSSDYSNLFATIGSLRNLRRLLARGSMNDECVRAFALTNRPPTLDSLCIGGITDAGVLNMISFTQLTYLDLSRSDIRDWSLVQLVCAGVNQLIHFFCCHCEAVNGQFIQPYLTQCPSLASIAVYGCELVDDTAISRCLDILSQRRDRLTLYVGMTNVTMASLFSNEQFGNIRLQLDWTICCDHGHDCGNTQDEF